MLEFRPNHARRRGAVQRERDGDFVEAFLDVLV
jgi:hypothetical protein